MNINIDNLQATVIQSCIPSYNTKKGSSQMPYTEKWLITSESLAGQKRFSLQILFKLCPRKKLLSCQQILSLI